MQRMVTIGMVVGWLSVGSAAANIAAPPPPAELTGLGFAGDKTALVIRAAELRIDCSAGHFDCRLAATYEVHNPTDVVTGGTAAFYALTTDDVTITIDGRPAGRRITAAEAGGFDQAVEAASGGGAGRAMASARDDLSRDGFDLSLAPGASARIEITGVIHPSGRSRYYMAVPAGPARHRLFRRGDPHPRRVRLDYLVAPIRTWGGFPVEMPFTLTHPTTWISAVRGATGLDQQDGGGVTVRRGRIATTEPTLEIDLDVARRTPMFGGLLLGIGGNVDDATGRRLRAGVELAVGEARLASLVVELEGDDAVVVVPAAAIASPWILLVPSFGLALGLPVRVRPSLEVGGRLQLDAHLGPVGLVTALDYYPTMSAGPRRFEVALFGQLAL